jgi:hypothetical protein
MYNCDMCNTSFEEKADFLAHPHIVQKKITKGTTFAFAEPEPANVPVLDVVLSLHDAAEQALWDLRQWVKDHQQPCECYTCGDSIPDLERALGSEHSIHGPCC